MAQKVIMTVGLSTEAGKEGELLRWYREVHIPEAKQQMQGIADVRLYENLKFDKNSPCLLAIWEFDNERAVRVVQEAIQNNQGGNYTPGPKIEIRLLSFFRQTVL